MIEFDCGQLRLARRKTGLKQLEAAEALGYSRSVMCQIENGARAVTAAELAMLANFYNVDDVREFFPERIDS